MRGKEVKKMKKARHVIVKEEKGKKRIELSEDDIFMLLCLDKFRVITSKGFECLENRFPYKRTITRRLNKLYEFGYVNRVRYSPYEYYQYYLKNKALPIIDQFRGKDYTDRKVWKYSRMLAEHELFVAQIALTFIDDNQLSLDDIITDREIRSMRAKNKSRSDYYDPSYSFSDYIPDFAYKSCAFEIELHNKGIKRTKKKMANSKDYDCIVWILPKALYGLKSSLTGEWRNIHSKTRNYDVTSENRIHLLDERYYVFSLESVLNKQVTIISAYDEALRRKHNQDLLDDFKKKLYKKLEDKINSIFKDYKFRISLDSYHILSRELDKFEQTLDENIDRKRRDVIFWKDKISTTEQELQNIKIAFKKEDRERKKRLINTLEVNKRNLDESIHLYENMDNVVSKYKEKKDDYIAYVEQLIKEFKEQHDIKD